MNASRPFPTGLGPPATQPRDWRSRWLKAIAGCGNVVLIVCASLHIASCGGLDEDACSESLTGLTYDEAHDALGSYTGGATASCAYFADDIEADIACVCWLDESDRVYGCGIRTNSSPADVLYWTCL